MSRSFLVLLQLVLWAVLGCFALTNTAASKTNYPIAKPNCVDHCGNVSIPFPFGLGEECALNSNFSITCNTSYYPPKPFITNSNVEVKDISVAGQLRIMKRVSKHCYRKRKWRSPLRSWYTSSKFYVNETANKFVAVGCDTFANVYAYGDDRLYRTGSNCMATCNSTQDVTNGTCSGFGCCETEIPNLAKNVYVQLDTVNNYTNTTDDVIPCSYALVVQKEEFNFSSTILSKEWDVEKLPMVLDWIISNETCNNACQDNSSCVAINGEGHRCACKEGYEGNPYLPPGCQDVDECENEQHNCSKNAICSNTEGGFECSCRKGYRGDGKSALGCTSSNYRRHIMLVLGISLGIITKMISCFGLYLKCRQKKSVKMKKKFFKDNGGLILQERIDQGSTSSSTTRIFAAELLTSRRALSFDGPEKERHLSQYFLSLLKENNFFQILDDNIVCQGNTEELREIALLAKRCLNVKGDDRPTMKEVAVELGGLRRATKHPWINNSMDMMESDALLTEQPIPFGYDATFSITSSTTEYDSSKHNMEFPAAAGR
nr:putative wall-associated receptor kinase-like 16 [Ipomoea batatas]